SSFHLRLLTFCLSNRIFQVGVPKLLEVEVIYWNPSDPIHGHFVSAVLSDDRALFILCRCHGTAPLGSENGGKGVRTACRASRHRHPVLPVPPRYWSASLPLSKAAPRS